MSGDALDKIAGQADAIDNQTGNPEGAVPGGPEGAPIAPPQSPNLNAIGFVLTAFRELSCQLLKVNSPRVTLSNENIGVCAQVLAPVADKYGINLGAIFEGPEGVALMVAGPILWAAADQLNMELKARRAKPVAEAAPDKDEPASQPANAG